MVNKGSFFQRLKERWGSGSGVKVDARTAVRGQGNGPLRGAESVQRVEPVREPNGARELAGTFAAAEAKSTRKLSDREEALLALGTHFQELSTLLRGSHARMDDQLAKLGTAADVLARLPSLSNQQLDLMRAMSGQLERQNALGEQVAKTLGSLPTLLQSVEGALARAAATDERTAATVREFQATMDRIHTSMGQMVEHSSQQAKAAQQLADRRDDAMLDIKNGIEQSNRSAVHELQRANEDSLESLRRTHEDQSNRLQRVVQEHAGWNKAVLVGIGLVVLGIGALIVLQLAVI
jgi:methyl-accepting chemotaxis protein